MEEEKIGDLELQTFGWPEDGSKKMQKTLLYSAIYNSSDTDFCNPHWQFSLKKTTTHFEVLSFSTEI